MLRESDISRFFCALHGPQRCIHDSQKNATLTAVVRKSSTKSGEATCLTSASFVLAYGSALIRSSVGASLMSSGMMPVIASATMRQSVSHCEVTETSEGQGSDDQEEFLPDGAGLKTNGDNCISSEVPPDVIDEQGDGEGTFFTITGKCINAGVFDIVDCSGSLATFVCGKLFGDVCVSRFLASSNL